MLPPFGKRDAYDPLMLTVIFARERGVPKNRKRIDWKLITNLQVRSPEEAIEKLNWYSCRWKIEIFHKVLKSGCKIEESKMRSAPRLAKLISVFCVLGWRVFWMTMLQRVPSAPINSALTDLEKLLLDKLHAKRSCPPRGGTLSHYLTKVAMLGGYLARTSDSPPGVKVMWRGLLRLTDIELGYLLGTKFVGN
ncbi:MAG: IS4 family transposase [Verrucomicrobiae bacterium]|nr:IS4 family transposase [Verrucomicrobiae bacterium]